MLVNEVALERLSRLPYMKNATSVLHYSVAAMYVARKATIGEPDWRVKAHLVQAGLSALHLAYATMEQFAACDDRPWLTPTPELLEVRNMIMKEVGQPSVNAMAVRLCEFTNSGFYRARVTTASAASDTKHSLKGEAFDLAFRKDLTTVQAFKNIYPMQVAKKEDLSNDG